MLEVAVSESHDQEPIKITNLCVNWCIIIKEQDLILTRL